MNGNEPEKLPWQCRECITDDFCIDHGECINRQLWDQVDEGEVEEGSTLEDAEIPTDISDEEIDAIALDTLKSRRPWTH